MPRTQWPRDARGLPETGERAAPEGALRDVQTLLADAVRRLHEAGAGDPVLAWTRRETGEAYLAAAAFEGDPPPAPEGEEFAALAGLSRAARLAEAGAPLAALAERHRCAAAAAVTTAGGEPLAALLLGGPARPRSLAALDTAARRLSGPLSAALAAARLARLDAEVHALDRRAALGLLAAEIAHEVRNPLVSIKTFLQLLPERRDPEFATHFLEVVSEDLRRVERLLDRVIEHARPPAGDSGAASTPVAGVLESVAELLRHRAHKRGVRLEVSRAPREVRVALGEDALRQVALNLALNAIEVTPSGGTVRIRECAGGFSVADQGPGIAPGLRDRVFEPFYSTRPESPGGLGLAITRRIVEAAGGSVRVGESAGGGAELRVTLPEGDVR